MGRVVTYSLDMGGKAYPSMLFLEAYPDAMEQAVSHVTADPVRWNFEEMTVKGMLEAVSGKIPTEWRDKAKGGTMADYCVMVASLKAGLDEFTRFMEATQPPVTIEQRKMASGILKGNLEEAVLWTLKTAFTLTGLEAAQQLTVYEYEVARKNIYNEAVVAYNQSMAAAAVARAHR